MLNHLLFQELKIAMTIALASNVLSWTVLQDHTFHKESVARSAQVCLAFSFHHFYDNSLMKSKLRKPQISHLNLNRGLF